MVGQQFGHVARLIVLQYSRRNGAHFGAHDAVHMLPRSFHRDMPYNKHRVGNGLASRRQHYEKENNGKQEQTHINTENQWTNFSKTNKVPRLMTQHPV